MNAPGSVTLRVEDCLRRIEEGDETAHSDLIDAAYDRLILITERIVGKMVSSSKGLRASDVFQDAYLRLQNALSKENVNPRTVGEFMGLAARHVRLQVYDLLRASKPVAARPRRQPQTAPDAGTTEMWMHFFEAFESLPEEERDVADLLWVWSEGSGRAATPNLSQSEAANVLGTTRDRVKDLWRAARIKIAKRCADFDPGLD